VPQIHHFTYGPLTPVLAYLASVIGCALGLQFTVRARARERRVGWLCGAAIAIGGTGIWVMHFIAMLGFSISGATIRYNIPLTLISAAIGMLVVGMGLFLVDAGDGSGTSLALGGAITGVGVAAMHYTGMAAMHTDVEIHYNAAVVAMSVVIAVVAATAALWFTQRIDGLRATAAAAMIMGVAVSGMHYTGMAAMRVRPEAMPTMPSGADPFLLLAPLILVVSLVTSVLLLFVGTIDNEDFAEL
jgi:NO-binding membrane sensor protein with MHYT domain